MTTAKRVGAGFLLVGSALLLIALALFVRVRIGQRTSHVERSAVPASATSSPVAGGGESRTVVRLGPTAEAAATRLQPPTPVPTGGPPVIRPSAPVRIVIPAAAVDARVVEIGWHVVRVGGEPRGMWDTAAGAAGHHRGSADPGQSGNCVLSAHSSDAAGATFRRLDELTSGDVVELYTVSGQRYEYVVTTVVTLDELGAGPAEKREHARWLDPTDEPTLTLVTCWPAWSYTHRIIVRAELHEP